MRANGFPISVVAGVFFLCLLAACEKSPESMTLSGEAYLFKKGKYTVKAERVSDYESRDFMLVGPGPAGNLPFTASLSGIPISKVDALEASYGDFLKCGSRGEGEGKRSVEHIVLFAENPGAESGLSEVARVAKRGYPVVRLHMARLKILSVDDKDPKRWGNVISNPYAVSEAAVVERDRQLAKR